MLEEWLIDGYNFLHSARIQGKKRSFSREQCFSVLANFASADQRKVLMVLDGHGKTRELHAYCTDNFQIIYSNELTADSVIERMLCEKKHNSLFVVITKDRAVSQMARGFGARVMEPDEFMVIVDADKKAHEDILFHEKIRSHGFNRPFEKKLKRFDTKVGPNNTFNKSKTKK